LRRGWKCALDVGHAVDDRIGHGKHSHLAAVDVVLEARELQEADCTCAMVDVVSSSSRRDNFTVVSKPLLRRIKI